MFLPDITIWMYDQEHFSESELVGCLFGWSDDGSVGRFVFIFRVLHCREVVGRLSDVISVLTQGLLTISYFSTLIWLVIDLNPRPMVLTLIVRSSNWK